MNTLKMIAVFSLSWLMLAGFDSSAQAEEESIRKAIAAYVEAFNKQDLKTVAAMWAEKGVHLDRETGERTEGRAAIVADISAVFKESPDTRLAGRVERVRMIKPDVASVDGQTSIGSGGDSPALSAFTAIFVTEGGSWVIDSMEEMPIPQPPTSFDALRELDWLVGRWVDRSDEARVDTTFRWSANHAYLLRSFSVQTKNGITQQGTQVIGWDPRSREIRSWSFNSDGSFGDGVWSRSGTDWLIKTSQTLADGRAASGTFVLTPIDDNTLTLKLIGHEIEGEPQPGSEAIRMERSADPPPATDSDKPADINP